MEQAENQSTPPAWLRATPRQTDRAIEVWIASPPSLRSNVATFNAVVDDLLNHMKRHMDGDIIEAGLCRYRITPHGRKLLADAWITGAVNLVMIRGKHPAWCSILGASVNDPVVEIDLILPLTDGEAGDEELSRIVSWVQRAVIALGAAIAFVFDDPFVRNNPFYNDFSREIHDSKIRSRKPRLKHWWAVCRYTRGPAWGTYLGPGLSERMGGQERITRDAPVWHAEQVGDGVWLQLAPKAPCALATADSLIAFLAPLYDWEAYRIEYEAWEAMHGVAEDTDVWLSKVPSDLPIRGEANAPLPSIYSLPNAETVAGRENIPGGWKMIVVTVNVHTAEPMAGTEREILRTVIGQWFMATHQLPDPRDLIATKISEPEISTHVARFVYGGNHLDYMPGIESLREWLATIRVPQVSEIVLGPETVE